MSIESLREVRDHFSDVVDRVQREHDRVTVTRNGKAAAIIGDAGREQSLVSFDDCEIRVF